MDVDFEALLDAEQRARRCIRANGLSIADERIKALIELVKALRVKFNQNNRAGVGLILIGVDDPSNLLPRQTIVRGNGGYSELELALMICAKFVCCSIAAASSLGAMVMCRKKLKIAARVCQIRF